MVLRMDNILFDKLRKIILYLLLIFPILYKLACAGLLP
ncbi:MAG: hypothetical protein K0S01_2506 [Herbinix sp.]|jgi:hypothetical protein|nr:hypothetical protein [Herbinix sp.]